MRTYFFHFYRHFGLDLFFFHFYELFMGAVKLKFCVLWFLEIILKFFWWLRVLCIFFCPLFFISGSPAKNFSGFVLSFSSLFTSSALALLSGSFLQLYSSISCESLLPTTIFYLFFLLYHLFYLIPASVLFLTLFHFGKRCSNSYIFSLRILMVISFYKLKMSETMILKESKGFGLWER